jgi:DNA-binding IclR family transcriptional regulator
VQHCCTNFRSESRVRFILGEEGCIEYMVSDECAGGRTVISKAAAILMTYLCGASHSLTEIAAITGLPLSTAHRLLCDMSACKLLERANNGEYRVAFPLRFIGAAARGPTDLEGQAHLVLQDLSHVLYADVRLGVLCDFEMAYIEKLAGRRPISTFEQDKRLPVHATAMGKALLAFAPREVVHLLLMRGLRAFTPYTITAPERLRRTLAMARLSRLAVARWEFEVGRSALAVPVFGPEGGVVAAIEVRVEDPAAELPTVRPDLLVAGRSLSRQLSYTYAACPRAGVGRRPSSIQSARTAAPSFRMERS